MKYEEVVDGSWESTASNAELMMAGAGGGAVDPDALSTVQPPLNRAKTVDKIIHQRITRYSRHW